MYWWDFVCGFVLILIGAVFYGFEEYKGFLAVIIGLLWWIQADVSSIRRMQ